MCRFGRCIPAELSMPAQPSLIVQPLPPSRYSRVESLSPKSSAVVSLLEHGSSSSTWLWTECGSGSDGLDRTALVSFLAVSDRWYRSREQNHWIWSCCRRLSSVRRNLSYWSSLNMLMPVFLSLRNIWMAHARLYRDPGEYSSPLSFLISPIKSANKSGAAAGKLLNNPPISTASSSESLSFEALNTSFPCAICPRNLCQWVIW